MDNHEVNSPCMAVVKGAVGGGVAALLLLPVLVVVLLTGADCTTPAATAVSSGQQVNVDKLPVQTVEEFSGEQLVNAAYIMNAGQALGLDAQGQAIGVMTAIGESTLVNVDYGDDVNGVTNPDGSPTCSLGLFQQQWCLGTWGTREEVMDPTHAATAFFQRLVGVEGWKTLEPSIAAHRIQGNADPYHYADMWAPAVEIVSALSGVQLDPSNAGAADSPACAVGASGDYPVAAGDPLGPWGGYENGKIDRSVLAPIPWTTGKPIGDFYLRTDAVNALIAMNNRFRLEFGYDLPINDGYRDYQGQVDAKEEYGDGAATAGTSNHGWALAIDIGDQSHYTIDYDDPIYNWLVANAGAYGWVHPEWAKPGGNGPHEAWHWEFYGVKTVA